MQRLLLPVAVVVLTIAAATSSFAAPIGLEPGGPGEETGSWQVAQGCGGCGPTTIAEWFITNDTGAGPFEAPGIDTFTLNPGWSGAVINPNYVLASGPTGNLGAWTEHYLGNIANSVTINLVMWVSVINGPVAFTAAYSRAVDGALILHCQQFGSFAGCAEFTPGAWDRTPSVPEPVTLLLVGGGVAVAWRRRFAGRG